MPLDPTNPFADLIPAGSPAVIQGPPKESTADSGYILNADGSETPRPGGPQDPHANDSLDDATTTFYAQQILAGAPMPGMGMGKVASQNRQAVMKKVAQLAGAQGLSGADLAKQIAHYQAGKKQLSTLENQLGAIRGSEQAALANGQQFLDRSSELPLQTQYPTLNSIIQFGQKELPIPGHETKAEMDSAWNTFVNEYGKVVSGAPSGAGVLSDSARREAQAVMQGNYSLSQKQAVFDQMKRDMANVLAARHQSINEGYDALTKQPGYQVPDDFSQFAVTGGQKQQDHVFIPGAAPPPSAVPGDSSGGSGGGGDGPPGMSELSPDQKNAYTAFLAANPKPSGDQVGAFLTRLTGKTVTNGDDIAKAIASGQGVSTSVHDSTEQQKVNARIAQENKLGLNESPAETLLKQGATLNLSDEAAGVGNALSNVLTAPFTGKFDPIGSYDVGRDVERQRIADARQQLGYGGSALEFAGALASANPEGALTVLAPKAAAVAAGKAGAAGGALAGFGAGEGAPQSIGGAVAGGATGYALGRYGPAALQKVLPQRLQPPQGMAPDLAKAAQAEGVDLIRPMVDPAARPKFGALESDPTAQPIVRAGAEKVRGQIEDRTTALGGGGTPLEDPGGVVQNAGRRFIQRSKGVANTLYNRARSIAGDARFVPQNAIDQVEAEVAALRKNPETNAGEINFLEGLHSDLATPGGKTVEELRQLRTSLRGRVNEQNLGATQAEARAMRAMDATQQDVAQNVPDAASAYQRADTYYRERQTHIDDVVKLITGGNVGADNFQVSSDAAFQRLKSMASPGGDGRRLAALMRDLDPSERQDIAATIAQGLGRRNPDEDFSTALFVSQTRKLSPSAQRTIFGPDGAQSIQNLRLLSRKLTDAGGDINRSRSTTVANRMSPIKVAARTFIGAITGLGGYEAGGIGGALAGTAAAAGGMALNAGRKVLSARAMVNPRVSRWLAESADASTPAAAKEATRKLGVIISREPALARELQPVYQFLHDRTALPLAAQPGQAPESNNEQQ